MRDKSGQFAKGHTGNPAGRPKRADEEFLINLWEKHGQLQFSEALKNGERWALKILIDKLYPNKKDADVKTNVEKPKPIIAFDAVFMPEDEKRRLLSLVAE